MQVYGEVADAAAHSFQGRCLHGPALHYKLPVRHGKGFGSHDICIHHLNSTTRVRQAKVPGCITNAYLFSHVTYLKSVFLPFQCGQMQVARFMCLTSRVMSQLVPSTTHKRPAITLECMHNALAKTGDSTAQAVVRGLQKWCVDSSRGVAQAAPEQKTRQTGGHPHMPSHCPRSGTAPAASGCCTHTGLCVPACTVPRCAAAPCSGTSESSLDKEHTIRGNSTSALSNNPSFAQAWNNATQEFGGLLTLAAIAQD